MRFFAWIALLGVGALAACARHADTASAPLALDCKAMAPVPSPWYPTVAAAEHGNDSQRTHVFAAACATLDDGRTSSRVDTLGGLPNLYNIVTRGADEVFALGGSFGRIDETNGPYVVAVDAVALTPRWRTRLPGITAADWNYPGVMGVHRNGDLYAIYGHHIARLDPAQGRVKAHADLPVNQSAVDVAYNGFTLLEDGSIVAKSIHRRPGCTEPDFKAFFDCETQGMAASTIVLLDPDTLAVRQSIIADEHIRFRATSTRFDGAEYVYLPGEDRIQRYRYDGGKLVYDAHWRATYRLADQSPGTAVAVLNDWIVIQTSGIPAKGPMSIVAVSQRDATKQFRIEPFAGNGVDGSFIPSLPTVDPENKRVYTFDGFAGQLAALDFDETRGFSVAWTARQRSFAFSALVGPPTQRRLVGTDMEGRVLGWLFERASLSLKLRAIHLNRRPRPGALVWRDAATGRELGRSSAIAAVGGGVPTPGYHGWLFAPDLAGEALARFTPQAVASH